MIDGFKPMLSGVAPEDLNTIKFPVLVSPKLDGIRALKINGKAVTRNLKPVPNFVVREWMERNLPDGIDGELLLRDPTTPFNEVSSAIMSRTGEPDFVFAAFDLLYHPDDPFFVRLATLQAWHDEEPLAIRDKAMVVPHYQVHTHDALQDFVSLFAGQGYEGTMVRDPNGPYKFGRSTTKEGYLLKIKAWGDEEAVVIGVVEEMANTNEATVDALGHTKRSTAKAGKVGKGRLGALRCRTADGAEFEIGSGFTEQQRIELWREHTTDTDGTGLGDVVGRLVKFKHQPPPGGRQPGQAPRFPVFLGFRHVDDMEAA